jgi:hypothetical protein
MFSTIPYTDEEDLVTGAVSDFVLAILPWFYIRNLQIGIKEKISVGFALSVGFLAGVCSILKIYYTSTLGARSDYSCKFRRSSTMITRSPTHS